MDTWEMEYGLGGIRVSASSSAEDIFNAYIWKFGSTFNSVTMSPASLELLRPLMLASLQGLRGPVRDKDLGGGKLPHWVVY